MKNVRCIYILWTSIILVLTNTPPAYCRKHQLNIKNDDRRYFPISTFGFYTKGSLQVNVKKFRLRPEVPGLFGFSLEKTSNPYTDTHPEQCELNVNHNDRLVQHVYFKFDLQKKQVNLSRSQDMETLYVRESSGSVTPIVKTDMKFGDSALMTKERVNDRSKREVASVNKSNAVSSTPKANDVTIHMEKEGDYYTFAFEVFVRTEDSEGLYKLEFHNCINYGHGQKTFVDMTLDVVEVNPDDNYLSAGEMPLPALYFMMSILFFLSACFWFFLLRQSKDPVFKIHYLMGVLVVIKSFSLMFHGLNYHFIQKEGIHIEAWAVMYYITHLLKGALLFTILALIGSGWAFIKHILSSKDNKIFAIVIPLQIIANVATIIIEETEEASARHDEWKKLMLAIDFLCCGAILFPVVWSIRHLQEASQTDGKAAMNLRKLKLFRHFYIMIVCYIYFTRIIVFLLKITVPFQYGWLEDMFREMATYVFFVITGYKFRPANNNPYFRVSSDDEEEMEEVLTTTALTEGVQRIKHQSKGDTLEVEVYQDDDEVNLLSTTKESSHAYD
ncbi:protein GPR107 isoform X2 [Oratosquilla oratoria]|uniref:protein GPR107 isoform X2 n=1 Tax=Oratosquilla oratoria TaxID=337810 RepID=UPI003F763C9B